jgi:hypothetical protein
MVSSGSAPQLDACNVLQIFVPMVGNKKYNKINKNRIKMKLNR